MSADRLIVFLCGLTEGAASTDWFDAPCAFDDELAARPTHGETTRVVAFVDGDRIIGASVGDSSAWLISPAREMTDLTLNQRRRPLLGTDEARFGDTLATRQDMLILRHEMAELRTELRQEMAELRGEVRQDMADLRHSFELKLASTVTPPQLYGALLGQMALLLGIAYFFVTHLQH